MNLSGVIITICLTAVVLLYLALRRRMKAKTPVDTDNAGNFGFLVLDLVRAYETPEQADRNTIEADLEKIRSVNESDARPAQALVDTWRDVYLEPVDPLFVYGKDDPARLAECGVVNSPSQAIVVLGFKLSDGGMQPELVSRCDAAAELAKAFPEAILVCTGGATGKNNPEKHTEASLMKDYLTKKCGIDPCRIHTDEEAKTTVDNVRRTFGILQKQGVRTMTIVTSQYHRKRALALYGVMARFCRQEGEDGIRSAGSFCCAVPADAADRKSDHRLAIQGMVELLHLPKGADPFT